MAFSSAPRRRRRGARKRPLVVVDLESATSPMLGSLTVRSIHQHVAPDAPLEIVVPGGPTDFLGQAARIVVTGSALMLEDVPWAPGLAHTIAQEAAAGTPVLAICFGHQMMVKHLGGRIGSFDQVRKGIETIRFDTVGPFGGDVPLIHTHRDHVVDPGQMVPCGQGGFGGVAATHHPTWPLWTVQGHPEWEATIARTDDAFWKQVPEADLATREAKGILRRFGQI